MLKSISSFWLSKDLLSASFADFSSSAAFFALFAPLTQSANLPTPLNKRLTNSPTATNNAPTPVEIKAAFTPFMAAVAAFADMFKPINAFPKSPVTTAADFSMKFIFVRVLLYTLAPICAVVMDLYNIFC